MESSRHGLVLELSCDSRGNPSKIREEIMKPALKIAKFTMYA
jgi:hypothetical protein